MAVQGNITPTKTYEYKGKKYQVLGLPEMKLNGEWVLAVLYRALVPVLGAPNSYVREYNDFHNKFTEAKD